jgi:hypothetical protein
VDERDSVIVDVVVLRFDVSKKDQYLMLRSHAEAIMRKLTDLCSLKPAGPSSSSRPRFRVLFHSANIACDCTSIRYLSNRHVLYMICCVQPRWFARLKGSFGLSKVKADFDQQRSVCGPGRATGYPWYIW